jgi:hypothetical protein
MVRDVSGTRSSEEFRLDLHASFGVPPDEVAAVVRKVTGRPMVSLSRVVRGQECEVYRAVADSDVEVVIRIKRFGEEGTLADEAWAMEQARRAGVPVPEVLLVDRLTSVDADLPVMVLAVAEGEALTDRAGLTAAERRSALARAGEVLARMNGVTVPGFWRPGPDGEWTKDWVALMTGFIADREAERDLVCGMGFGAAEFDRMIALLRLHSGVPLSAAGAVSWRLHFRAHLRRPAPARQCDHRFRDVVRRAADQRPGLPQIRDAAGRSRRDPRRIRRYRE